MPQSNSKVAGILGAALLFAGVSYSQGMDSVKSGYLTDPAEEFWPCSGNNIDKTNGDRLKHFRVNQGRGFVNWNLNIREGYEYYDRYLWGIGIQDNNGYFLHRFLLHTVIRWNDRIRLFTQIQSSTI